MNKRVSSERHIVPIENRQILYILLLAITIFTTGAVALAAGKIHWWDVKSGLIEGKRTSKFVLVDVYTDWCGPCRLMDKETFSDQDLIDFLDQKFICVKANAEDKGQGQKFAKEYDVHAYPSGLVLDQNGKLRGRVIGFRNAQEYRSVLEDILSGS